MAAALPGFASVSPYFESQAQMVTYLCLHYLTILVYASVFALTCNNVWRILIKQREYKNLPILFFYVFALIAVPLRMLALIFEFSQFTILQHNLGYEA